MRHGKKINHLGRTASHRKAMLSNMATSLILHKRITTTVAKAKALRKYVEPLITKSKTDTTHSRRTVFSYLQDKESAQVLFDDVASKVADRPGGYTRIIKFGNRLGDNAEMCMIELVDYNETYVTEEKPGKRTRRSRRGGGGKKKSAQTTGTQGESAQESNKEKGEEQVEATADSQQQDESAAKKDESANADETDETTKEDQNNKEGK